LIQWEDGLVDDAIWEDNAVLAQTYPHFNLEDKVNFDGGRNVRKRDTKAKEVDSRVGSEGIFTDGHVVGGTKSMTRCKGARSKRISTRLKDFEWGIH